MKSVSIQISDLEFDQWGLKKENLSFAELVDIVRTKITKETLVKCTELSEKYGLSEMTMEEISAEVKAQRNASGNS